MSNDYGRRELFQSVLRPTVGLVPAAPAPFPFVGFGVKGPMARSVADTAFLLSVMAGPDPRDPSCYPSDPAVFGSALERDLKGVRVAWCPDLGGLPLDRRVRSVLDAQRKTFEDFGCSVHDACPDLSGADKVFLDIRTWVSWNVLGPLRDGHRSQMKPEAIWQIESGARLSGTNIARAMIEHGDLMERMRRFQERYEFRPAMSVPAGFTTDGLPVGLQIVGRYRDDFGVLQIADAFEQATGFGRTRPVIAIG